MKKGIALLAALLITLTIMIASCGPSGPDTEESLAPTEEGLAPTTAPVETEAVAEVMSILRVGSGHGPDCLNPFGCADHWDYNNVAIEGLTGLGPRCEVLPRLAKSMEVSDDGLTWRIDLQEGARFTDGTPFNAQVLADFPDLESEDIRAVLAFAADRERKLFNAPSP